MDGVAFLVQILLVHSNIAEIILSISTCTSVMYEYFNVITLNCRYQPDPTYTFVGVGAEKYVKTILLDRFSEESNFRVNFTGELQKIIVSGENEKLCHNFNVPPGVRVIIGDRDCMSIQTVISTLKERVTVYAISTETVVSTITVSEPTKTTAPAYINPPTSMTITPAMTSTATVHLTHSSTFETDFPAWTQSLSTTLLVSLTSAVYFCRRKCKKQKQQTIPKSIHTPDTECKQYDNIPMSVRKVLRLHDLNEYRISSDSECTEVMFSL